MEPLATQLRTQEGQSSHVPARPREACNKSHADGVDSYSKDDGYSLGDVLGRDRRWRAPPRHDDINLETNKFRCKVKELMVLPLGRPILDDYVLALALVQLNGNVFPF